MDTAQKGDSKSGDRQVQGGWTAKIVASCDALGNLVRFRLLPGNRNDTVGVAPLIEGVSFDALLADKAFDSNWDIEEMNQRGTQIVISQRPQRTNPLAIDVEMYKWRHLIENLFGKLKEFKAIALRCERTDRNFTSMIYACAPIINSQ